ncbi:MAG TPA: molybdate ABC transporter substrate-binding protein [Terriglobales bacterium]
MTPVTPARSVGRSVNRSISRSVCRYVGLTLIVILAGSSLLAQTTLTVAAAADMQPLMQEMVSSYEALTQNRELVTRNKGVVLVFGSSGNLTSQIENGAPYDVFFSADSGFPRRLISEGRAIADSLHVYAIGKLAIWVPAGSRLDLDHLGAKALLDPSVHKIAIANPQHAPYGRAAAEALKDLGVYDQVSSKLVLGENVSQAAEFISSGNAQAGIVALSVVLGSKMKYGHYWIVPQQHYQPLRQAVVIVAGSKHPEAARDFVNFFLRQRDPHFLPSYGFDLPPAEEHK